MKPKPENPIIAIPTFRMTLAQLMLPITAEEVVDGFLLKISVQTAPSRELSFKIVQTPPVPTYSVFLVEKIRDKELEQFVTQTTDYASALMSVIFMCVTDVVSSANEHAVSNYIASTKSESQTWCENCRQLVPYGEYGTTACKTCEAEND